MFRNIQGLLISFIFIAAVCSQPPKAGAYLGFTAVADNGNDVASGSASYYVAKVFKTAEEAADSSTFWGCTALQCYIIPNMPTPALPGARDSIYVSFDNIDQDTLYISIVACDTTGTLGKELRGQVSNVAMIVKPDEVRPARIIDLHFLRFR